MYQFNENHYPQGMTQAMTRSFVSTVFLWMFAALGITAATAFLFGTNESLMRRIMLENLVLELFKILVVMQKLQLQIQ